MNIKSMPEAIELLSKVDEIVQKEGSKILALRTMIANKRILYLLYTIIHQQPLWIKLLIE